MNYQNITRYSTHTLALLGDLEEGSHGVLSEMRRGAVGHLDGCDPQRPHVCPGIVVILQLLLTGYHLGDAKITSLLCNVT